MKSILSLIFGIIFNFKSALILCSMFVLAACGTGGGTSISSVIDNPNAATEELDTTASNPTETDESDTSTVIFFEATITAEEDVTVEYDETIKVVISINATRTNLTETTVTEVTGTVTKTYIDTSQISTTYSSYRNDVVTFRRIDRKQTYSDGVEITTEGTPTPIATITGTIVEHDVTNSDPVLISRVLVSTVDSGDNIVNVSYTDTDANLGVKTSGLTTNPEEFLTTEVRGYCARWQGCTLENLTVWTADDLANGTGTSYQHIETAGINNAWARGWTGKGVNVGIIDTGVNIDHNELDGQIGGVYNNSSTDWNGHGTHVAGTIVAKRDGQGMVGVAFDSKLYVVRSPSLVYQNSNYWNYFKDNDVDVVNLSINGRWDSNINFDDNYVVGSDPNNQLDTYNSLSLIDADKNLYKWNKTIFRNGSYVNLNQVIAQDDSGNFVYGGMGSIETLASNMANSEIILVNSAGNNQRIAMTPGWYATATNEDGSLMLDGRLIIVGSYDPASGTNNRYSANAGSICWNVVNDVCQDPYHVSDFFIRAPEGMTSLDNVGDQYADMSGTSMAAPVVTGSVALLRQMWPHMTGSDTVQLILTTADSSYQGYNEGIDGHGRLDMNAATLPIGATGIPTEGRTDGNSISSSGYVAGNNAIPSSVSSLIVETSGMGFNRDWLIPIAHASVPADNAIHSFTDYAGLQRLGTSDIAVHLRENDTDRIAVTIDGTTLGFMKEDGQYLGRYFNGIFGIGETRTAFLQKHYSAKLDRNTLFSANMNIGYTEVDTISTSLINHSDDLLSYGWKAQIDNRVDDNWSVAGFLAQPISVFSGSMNINAPTSRNGDAVAYTNTEWSQSAKTETDLGIKANFTNGDFNWNIGGVKRFDTALGDIWSVKTVAGWKF